MVGCLKLLFLPLVQWNIFTSFWCSTTSIFCVNYWYGVTDGIYLMISDIVLVTTMEHDKSSAKKTSSSCNDTSSRHKQKYVVTSLSEALQKLESAKEYNIYNSLIWLRSSFLKTRDGTERFIQVRVLPWCAPIFQLQCNKLFPSCLEQLNLK